MANRALTESVPSVAIGFPPIRAGARVQSCSMTTACKRDTRAIVEGELGPLVANLRSRARRLGEVAPCFGCACATR
jgi:hypothetical protein